MIGTLKNVHVESVTATVSKTRVPVEEVVKDLLTQKKAKRLVHGTGVEALSIVPQDVCTSDLCYESAQRLLEKTDADEVGALLFVSQTADYLSPATSYLLQKRLGLRHDILAFDINLGCSGFCYGVFLAGTLLPALGGRKVLVCCGDTSSRNAYPADTSMLSISGDAGAAAIVAPAEGKDISYHVESFGERADCLLIPRGGYRANRLTDTRGGDTLTLRADNYVVMDGMAVMNFTTEEVPRNIKELLAFAHVAADEIDCAVLHQPNAMVLKTLAASLGIGVERVPFESSRIGNASSASIPVCLAELERQRKYHPAEKYLLSGFGVGLSVATLLTDFSETRVEAIGEL